MTTFQLGDWVLLDDGREAQVTENPDPDAFTIRVWTADCVSVDVRPTNLQMVSRQLPSPSQSTDHTARLIRAARTHVCAGRPGIVMHYIRRGDEYVLTKVFPGHESGAAGTKGETGSAPVSKKLCTTCAAFYPDTDPSRLGQVVS